MIIDMHVHTSEGSECSRSGIEDHLDALEKLRHQGRGIDGLVITDHGVLSGNREADEELSSRYGILILRGVEVNTDYCHMLIYGLEQEMLEGLQWSGERTLSAREVIDTTARIKGVIAIPAHPFRACPVGGHRDFSGVSIIEVFNGANNETQDLRAVELAAKLNCKTIAGSDAHGAEELGKCVTVFDSRINSMEGLVEELEKGSFRASKYSGDGRHQILKPYP